MSNQHSMREPAGMQLNATNGSWWIVQIPPTRRHAPKQINPTNGSWWMVQILPTRKPAPKQTNPTNGSWWMVQIQPIKTCSQTNKSHQRQFVDCSDPALHRNRLQPYSPSMYLT